MRDTQHLHIEFYIKPVEDKKASLLQGRPIFRDEERIRIRFKGDRNREHHAPAHEKFQYDRQAEGYITYAEAFPRHYEAFKSGQAVLTEGTPLTELPFISSARREELKAFNIHTAEDFTTLDGEKLTKLGPGHRALKTQVEAWLQRAKDSALENRMAAEMAELREMNERMRQQLEALASGVGARAIEQPAEPDVDPFENWSDAHLKQFIRDRTGQMPRGNPSHETLVRMAEEAERAESAAA